MDPGSIKAIASNEHTESIPLPTAFDASISCLVRENSWDWPLPTAPDPLSSVFLFLTPLFVTPKLSLVVLVAEFVALFVKVDLVRSLEVTWTMLLVMSYLSALKACTDLFLTLA